MSGDSAHRHNSADGNSPGGADGLDRVVPDTPLTPQQRTRDGAIGPSAETPAPPPVSTPGAKPVLKVVIAKASPDRIAANSLAIKGLEPFVAEDPATYQIATIPGWRRWSVVQVAAIALGIVAGVEFFLLVSQFRGRGEAVTLPAGGTVTVESTPSGAEIMINGQQRGTTPSTVTLNPGEYALSLRGTVTHDVPLVVRGGTDQHIYVAEGEPAGKPEPSQASRVMAGAPPPEATATPRKSAATPPAPSAVGGWVSIDAPIDVQLFERGALIGSNQSDRIMLPVGPHVIEAVNTSLGYKASSTVQVAEGSVARLRLVMPPGTLNINALPWADVSVDGQSLGSTPLANVSLPIGPHEIVFTHPQLGEQRQTVTVTQNGVNRVSANLNQR